MTGGDAFWRGRRVLVTGHTGFKGAWLTLWLLELGADVTGYALPPEAGSLFADAGLSKDINSVEADVRDADAVARAVREARPEVLLHLAAQPLVRRSYAEPVLTYATNVMGTVNVLEAARAAGDLRATVVVTSDKCYDNSVPGTAYAEDAPLGGHDPYSSSKAGAELVTAAYRDSYDLRVATARAGNVIGGGDWAQDRLVPDAMRALIAGRPVRVRNPESTRPWQHVLNCLDGYLTLAAGLAGGGTEASGAATARSDAARAGTAGAGGGTEAGGAATARSGATRAGTAGAGGDGETAAGFAEAYNFGPPPGEARPVRWLADRLCAEWGDGAAWEADPGPHPAEAPALSLDSTKAAERLGWWPKWSLDQAIDRTVEWHRTVAEGADVRTTTFVQLDAFMNAPGR